MIREAEPFDVGRLPTPADASFVLSAMAVATGPVPADVESAEHEIARLTWSALEGSASLADRQRLAALVNAQHSRRRRTSGLPA